MKHEQILINIRHDMDEAEFKFYLELIHKFCVGSAPITTKKEHVTVEVIYVD